MAQLNFLHRSDETSSLEPIKATWRLFIDGASRNNPGKAGAGIYLLKDNEAVYQEGFYLGIKTNNQAEYLALLLGLFLCKQYITTGDVVHIISDSQLLIRQLKREYRVKHKEIKILFEIAQKMLQGLNVEFVHVLRDQNKRADALANSGIDSGRAVPTDFALLLQSHGFSI